MLVVSCASARMHASYRWGEAGEGTRHVPLVAVPLRSPRFSAARLLESELSLAFAFGCDLIQKRKLNRPKRRRIVGEALFGSDLRPRDHRWRRQWVWHCARCCRSWKFGFPL